MVLDRLDINEVVHPPNDLFVCTCWELNTCLCVLHVLPVLQAQVIMWSQLCNL